MSETGLVTLLGHNITNKLFDCLKNSQKASSWLDWQNIKNCFRQKVLDEATIKWILTFAFMSTWLQKIFNLAAVVALLAELRLPGSNLVIGNFYIIN